MNTILTTVLITFGFVLLLAVTYNPVARKHPKTDPLSKQPKPKNIIMGPETPAWMRMYVEEMAKRKTALTANVLKKWIAEDTSIELRPDISR